MKKTNYFMALAVVFSLAGLLAGESSATLVTVGADFDTYLNGNGTTATAVGWGGDAIEQVAGTNSREYILVFQLPSLSGESITTADLAASVHAPPWQSWGNIDLYGIRSDAADNTVVPGDYGVYGDSASGTKIQDSFYVSNSGTGAYESLSTNSSGDSALATWLDAQYSSVGAGGYVFLRMQPDHTDAIGIHAVQFISANHTTGTTPLLSITTVAVPEPSSLAFFGISLLAMSVLRKKV